MIVKKVKLILSNIFSRKQKMNNTKKNNCNKIVSRVVDPATEYSYPEENPYWEELKYRRYRK